MPTVNFARILRRALAATLCLLGAVGAARADLVTGIWDPFFGAPFNNLGYRGVAVFEIPGACLDGPNGQVFNTDACSGGNMRTVSMTVEFYDGSNEVLPLVETLVFDPLAIAVNYVNVDDGDAIGVGTGYAPWVQGNTTFENVNGYFFSIFMTGDVVQMVYKPSGSQQDVAAAAAAGQLSNPAQVRFSRQVTSTVPEPGSLALAGLALAAAGMAARRRG